MLGPRLALGADTRANRENKKQKIQGQGLGVGSGRCVRVRTHLCVRRRTYPSLPRLGIPRDP